MSAMALIPDDYTWTAGTVATEPEIKSPSDGHHLVVRFDLTVERKDGTIFGQPIEARGATARYLQAKGVERGNFVVAAGIIRTDRANDSKPYLLLRIVSVETSETGTGTGTVE